MYLAGRTAISSQSETWQLRCSDLNNKAKGKPNQTKTNRQENSIKQLMVSHILIQAENFRPWKVDTTKEGVVCTFSTCVLSVVTDHGVYYHPAAIKEAFYFAMSGSCGGDAASFHRSLHAACLGVENGDDFIVIQSICQLVFPWQWRGVVQTGAGRWRLEMRCRNSLSTLQHVIGSLATTLEFMFLELSRGQLSNTRDGGVDDISQILVCVSAARWKQSFQHLTLTDMLAVRLSSSELLLMFAGCQISSSFPCCLA